MNRLATVVLNWNGADLLDISINSLLGQTWGDFQIIVVDNNSTDNSRAKLEQLKERLKDKIHVIYNKKNIGFAGGVNTGIQYALKNGFDGVALLNNDATADKNWLKELAEVLKKKPEVGVVTTKLLHSDGKTIDSTGDWYSTWGLGFPRGRGKPANIAPESGYVFGASGGATLYRTSMLKEIGMFDETFFAYYEDVDMSFRAQLAGWKVYYEAKAIAYHEQGGTFKQVPKTPIYQSFKNWPMLFLKNVPTKFLGIIGPRLFLAYWLMFFNTIKKGTFLYALRGMVVSLYYIPHALTERRKIQRHKKVTDSYIASILWPSLPPEQTGLRKFIRLFNGRYDE